MSSEGGKGCRISKIAFKHDRESHFNTIYNLNTKKSNSDFNKKSKTRVGVTPRGGTPL